MGPHSVGESPRAQGPPAPLLDVAAAVALGAAVPLVEAPPSKSRIKKTPLSIYPNQQLIFTKKIMFVLLLPP